MNGENIEFKALEISKISDSQFTLIPTNVALKHSNYLRSFFLQTNGCSENGYSPLHGVGNNYPIYMSGHHMARWFKEHT